MPGNLQTRPFSLRSGTVLREIVGQNRTHSPSVRLTRTAAKNRDHTRRQKQAGEASWLKWSREGSKGSEDSKVKKTKKWETRPGGGGKSQNQICLTIVTETKDDWCKEQKRFEKKESRVLISQHARCGQVQTKVSYGKPGQDKAGVRWKQIRD